jgi:hypothetical protein
MKTEETKAWQNGIKTRVQGAECGSDEFVSRQLLTAGFCE